MSSTLKKFLESFRQCHQDIVLAKRKNEAHLYIERNNILSLGKISGLEILAEPFSDGVKMKIVVKKGKKINQPIFLCFGVLGKVGVQKIVPEIILEDDSEAQILAHCFFPQAENIQHQMKAKIQVGKRSKLFYQEIHYHGENFGAIVQPEIEVLSDQNSIFGSKFILSSGTVGQLNINLTVRLKREAVADIFSKIIGQGSKDEIRILDKIILEGERSRSLIKMRGVVVKGGKLFFQGETRANSVARGSQGHMDCQEIVIGQKSLAQSIPIIQVENPEARITHEASVGKVNQKELEVLMTRGLSEKEAIDFIIRGRLKE
mgnify:FL=1